MNRLNVAACILAAVALAGCAADRPSHYYTLMPHSQGAAKAGSEAGGAANAPADAVRYAISVSAVELPQQVDRPQIVITDPDSTQVMPLGDSLWASPLSYEIRNALSDMLSRRLDVLDVSATGIPDTLPVWTVLFRVNRFESLYDRYAVLDATWRLTPVNQSGKAAIICRGTTQVPVRQGMSALVAGHQQALRQLASVIAEQIEGGRIVAAEPTVNLKGCTSS